MAMIEAYECEECGKILKSKSGYTSHVNKHEKVKAEQKAKVDAQKAAAEEKSKVFSHLYNAPTLEDLIVRAKGVINKSLDQRAAGDTKIIDLRLEVRGYNESYLPHGRKDRIEAISGIVFATYTDSPKGALVPSSRNRYAVCTSSLLNEVGIITGGGGYWGSEGGYQVRYDFHIPLSKFPEILKSVQTLCKEKDYIDALKDSIVEDVREFYNSSDQIASNKKVIEDLEAQIAVLEHKAERLQKENYTSKRKMMHDAEDKYDINSKIKSYNERSKPLGLKSQRQIIDVCC